MKQKTKVILTSCATVAMCASLVVGGTFALFTSEDQVNIAVTSGRVKIEATVGEFTLFSRDIVMDGDTWANGGTAALTGKTVTLTNITPGDKVTFPITVTNTSNVSVMYRASAQYTMDTTVEDDLSEVLEVSFGAQVGTMVNGTTKCASAWQKLLNGADPEVMEVSIEFPYSTEDQNEYQEKEATIDLLVEAVQANADIPDEEEVSTVLNIGTPAELQAFAAEVNGGNTYKGWTVNLTDDIDMTGVEWTPIQGFEGTFNGAKASSFAMRSATVATYTISNLTVVGTDATLGAGLFGHLKEGTIQNVAFDNAYIDGREAKGAAVVAGKIFPKGLVENCYVTNSTVVAYHYAGGVVGYLYGSVKGCTVENFNGKVSVTQLSDGSYDYGDKLGGIVGLSPSDNGGVIEGNKVVGATLVGYRDVGGIAGSALKSGVVTGSSVTDIVIGQDLENGYKSEVPTTFGAVAGNFAANSNPNGSKKYAKATLIETVDEFKAFAEEVNAGDNYAGKAAVLVADIDLNGEEWTPIGNSTNSFQGIFDGNGYTVSNLVVNGGSGSNKGLFGMTQNGEVKNLTVNNALVSGRLNVGVVAGTPYTSKYTNITVTGHVEVNGMAYVGGVLGKNAYANVTNVTVAVDETSYVKANSLEDGKAYRTYVGGVIGFMGEGGHTVSNVTCNIDVYGNVCDIGGIAGIAHYGNNFVNCSYSGDIKIECVDTDAVDGKALEAGGIVGVWHNGGSNVTLENCVFTGTLTATLLNGTTVTEADLANDGLVNKAYGATGTGELIIK